MVSKAVEIKNRTGLHARPATDLCTLSKRFESKITLLCPPKTINPRSAISILMGEVTCGKTVEIQVEGPDEQEALDALVAFLEDLKE